MIFSMVLCVSQGVWVARAAAGQVSNTVAPSCAQMTADVGLRALLDRALANDSKSLLRLFGYLIKDRRALDSREIEEVMNSPVPVNPLERFRPLALEEKEFRKLRQAFAAALTNPGIKEVWLEAKKEIGKMRGENETAVRRRETSKESTRPVYAPLPLPDFKGVGEYEFISPRQNSQGIPFVIGFNRKTKDYAFIDMLTGQIRDLPELPLKAGNQAASGIKFDGYSETAVSLFFTVGKEFKRWPVEIQSGKIFETDLLDLAKDSVVPVPSDPVEWDGKVVPQPDGRFLSFLWQEMRHPKRRKIYSFTPDGRSREMDLPHGRNQMHSSKEGKLYSVNQPRGKNSEGDMQGFEPRVQIWDWTAEKPFLKEINFDRYAGSDFEADIQFMEARPGEPFFFIQVPSRLFVYDVKRDELRDYPSVPHLTELRTRFHQRPDGSLIAAYRGERIDTIVVNEIATGKIKEYTIPGLKKFEAPEQLRFWETSSHGLLLTAQTGSLNKLKLHLFKIEDHIEKLFQFSVGDARFFALKEVENRNIHAYFIDEDLPKRVQVFGPLPETSDGGGQ
jgi:hypothetical protein